MAFGLPSDDPSHPHEWTSGGGSQCSFHNFIDEPFFDLIGFGSSELFFLLWCKVADADLTPGRLLLGKELGLLGCIGSENFCGLVVRRIFRKL